MGQQQLLLLVLSIVIVGLAVVNGIEVFEDSSEQALQDRRTTVMVDIAARIDAWRKTPSAMGGGSGQANFFALTFGALGMSHASTDDRLRYQEHVGCMEIRRSSLAGESFAVIRIHTVEACPERYTDLQTETIAMRMQVYDDRWRFVHGTNGGWVTMYW
ncbi:MAG: hypothetical protein AAF624_04960 [Bacteroidota bacterium]